MKTDIVGDMPHSLEAEQSLLGCLLLDSKVQVEIAPFLKEDDFFAESHKYIFGAMNDIIAANQTVDLVVLADRLEKKGVLENAGGIKYLTELTSVMPSAANYQKYFDIVTRDSLLRKLIKGSSEIIKDCMSSTDKVGSLSFAEKTVYDIANAQETSSLEKVANILPAVMNKLDEVSKDPSSIHGLPTKYKGLDALLNGLHGSDLIVLAARPGMGKTSFAMNICENVALSGKTCAVFSLEMNKAQLLQRMLCSIAEVNMGNAVSGRMNREEWVRITKAKELLSKAKIFIDDTAGTRPRELLSKCRRLKRTNNGLDLVIVDYIQLLTPDTTKKDPNRQQEISDISRTLKIMAKELDVPVIALSQLSRAVENRKGRPQLSDLRESGAIEQDADIVIFIHRPDKDKMTSEKDKAESNVQPNVAEIIVEKHRNGPQGIVKLYFKGECTKFKEIDFDTMRPEGEEEKKQTAHRTEYEDLPDNGGNGANDNAPAETDDDDVF